MKYIFLILMLLSTTAEAAKMRFSVGVKFVDVVKLEKTLVFTEEVQYHIISDEYGVVYIIE